MASGIRQFLVYAKVTIMATAFIGAALIVFMNRNNRTSFWAGKTYEDVPTLWLMLLTAIVSVLVFWLLSKVRRVWRELAEIRAQKQQAALNAESEKRRQELEQQERRIDEKLKKALDDEKSQA